LRQAQRHQLLSQLEQRGPATLHLGDCIHADAECHAIALWLDCWQGGVKQPMFYLVGHPPLDNNAAAHCNYHATREPKAYLARDADIVFESEELLACPANFEEELRSGTWTTIRMALRADKPVVIIWPDGSTDDGAGWYAHNGRYSRVLVNRLRDELAEAQAVPYVQRNARYHPDAPAYARYAVRYPATASEAFFADDTRKLVEQVKVVVRKEMFPDE
jgi:hypothetical protein